MMDAFSNASEVWVVGLVVKASFLLISCYRLREQEAAYQVKDTLISENRSSSSSSCPKYLYSKSLATSQPDTHT